MEPTIDMTVSPIDRDAERNPGPSLVTLQYRRPDRWVASRFNAQTVVEDGRLILWNTYTGAISVFQAKDRERVLGYLKNGAPKPLDKAAAYLEKRGYLVREGTNELDRFRYYYGREHWRTDRLHLHLLASEDCNFRCVYCYEKFKRGTMRPEVREGVKALLRARVPELKQFGVGWFGGEPLYGWEAVKDLAPYFKKICAEHGILHYQTMTTNGYLLTEERATLLLESGCRSFQITVDGLPEDHNCKRVGRDGSPTYDVIMDNLRSLQARNGERFVVSLRVNFDRDNAPRLSAFLESLSETFAGDDRFRLRLRAVGQWGGEHDAELDVCGTDEQRTVLRALTEQARGLDLAQDGGIADFAAPGSQVCYAARPQDFIVGAAGQLMKCTIALDDEEENIVGQLHPDGTMELFEDRMALWVKPHFESDSLCQKCYVLPGCQGAACPLTRIREGTRTCCETKSNLKHQMRSTLADWDARRAERGVLTTV